MKNIPLLITLVLISSIVGYRLGSNSIITKQAKLDTIDIPVSSAQPTPSPRVDQKPPYCLMGTCPTFYSMDLTKGETQSYTVVRQPTHITKGAGQIWVIDGGQNIIFKSDTYANVAVEPSKEHDGFYITFVTGDNYDIHGADKVTYNKDKFEITRNIKFTK